MCSDWLFHFSQSTQHQHHTPHITHHTRDHHNTGRPERLRMVVVLSTGVRRYHAPLCSLATVAHVFLTAVLIILPIIIAYHTQGRQDCDVLSTIHQDLEFKFIYYTTYFCVSAKIKGISSFSENHAQQFGLGSLTVNLTELHTSRAQTSELDRVRLI